MWVERERADKHVHFFRFSLWGGFLHRAVVFKGRQLITTVAVVLYNWFGRSFGRQLLGFFLIARTCAE
jgi:hypothetical protein